MHRLALLLYDLFLVAMATLGALALRDNLAGEQLDAAQLLRFSPYLLCTLAVAAVIIPVSGLNRSIWRLSAMGDYLTVTVAAVAIVLGAMGLGFSVNRLAGVARGLPILQGLLMVFVLIGVRVSMRLRHAVRRRPRQLAKPEPRAGGETVLIVGLNSLTELYLRAASEFASGQLKIAGLLAQSERHAGRTVQQIPVLGTPEQIVKALDNLEVHGVFVERIVVTTPFASLPAAAQSALLEIEKATAIRIDFVAERMGLTPHPMQDDDTAIDASAFAIEEDDLGALRRRLYWRFKRLLDAGGALVLLVLFAPIMVLVAVLVAIDLGRPVVFWQQRPGLGGMAFRLYKFRSMAAAHDRRGRPVLPAARLTPLGRFLRRTRLDELPQLLNILRGDMSFIGPRPLLPIDQPDGTLARLVVRPGLTGWAQVQGGRAIGAADKAALDIWYVRNASLALDLRILRATATMVLFGERVNHAAIDRAWAELGTNRLCAAGE